MAGSTDQTDPNLSILEAKLYPALGEPVQLHQMLQRSAGHKVPHIDP